MAIREHLPVSRESVCANVPNFCKLYLHYIGYVAMLLVSRAFGVVWRCLALHCLTSEPPYGPHLRYIFFVSWFVTTEVVSLRCVGVLDVDGWKDRGNVKKTTPVYNTSK